MKKPTEVQCLKQRIENVKRYNSLCNVCCIPLNKYVPCKFCTYFYTDAPNRDCVEIEALRGGLG